MIHLKANLQISENQFTQIANSGKPFNGMVLDFTDMQYKTPLPILLEHDVEKRIGFADKVSYTNEGLTVEGYLLTNELAGKVIQDAKDGFPWEASVHITAGSVKRLKPGQTAVVNGVTVSDVTVFSRLQIKESSFVTLGADSATKSIVLNYEESNVEEITQEMYDEVVSRATKAEEALAALNAEMQALIKALRIKELEETEISDEAKEAVAELEESKYALIKNALLTTKVANTKSFTSTRVNLLLGGQ